MDQQKMFSQMVPSNYIIHGFKHTRSDRDHLASIPICPWLTHTKLQNLFPKGSTAVPGIQNTPGNKPARLELTSTKYFEVCQNS